MSVGLIELHPPQDSKVDGYGFERSEDFDEHAYETFMSSYLMILARRASRWRPLVFGKEKVLRKSRKLKRFCRKGIPAEHRPMVWMEVSGAGARMREEPDCYRRLLSQKLDPAVKETIMLDIHRTFPDNIYFADIRDPAGLQKPLRNVLIAFAMRNPRIGYCQGLNFIAGLMLLILRSEEKAFWLLDTLADRLIPDFYAPDMVAVKAEQEVFGDIVKWKRPDLHSHLDQVGFHWSLVGMKWFICLFADVLPVETVLRIWDVLFYEGSKVLLRVALTLVLKKEKELLQADSFPTVVDVFKTATKDQDALNCHDFMRSIFTETGTMPQAKIRQMRESCTKGVLAQS